MDPTLLRQLWSVVETSHSSVLLGLDDSHLVEWLIGQIAEQRGVEPTDTGFLSDYIRSRLSLIRDLAQS